MSKDQSTQTKQTETRFFATPAHLRAWLEANYDSATELWVGFHRKATGRPSLTWPQSVEEALCFGWIDGIRKKIDDERYMIRFTPRKPKSTWSLANIKRVKVLQREGRIRPAGRAAFERRVVGKSAIYSFENRDSARLSELAERKFRRYPSAWEFFQAQPPGYRRVASWWVISARRPETREKRLGRLIHQSKEQRRIY